MKNNKQSPTIVNELVGNEVFVFGSNLQGMHMRGAARLALKWGAMMGQGVGLQGRTYAIPTMSGSVSSIKPYVDEFIIFAKKYSYLKFLVTEIGCGIAGYTPDDVAPLFKAALNVDNIYLPSRFLAILSQITTSNDLESVGLHNTYKIDDLLYAGEYPGDKEDVKTMAKISKFGQAGIVEFIDLTQDKHLKPYNKFVHGGMEYNNFPIQDVSVPSQPEYMYDIVSYINRAIEREHKTYIHCWGGVGRTGTVVACYFVYKGDTAEQALMKLAVLWKSCEKSKRKPNSPETNEQLVFVYKFADFMMQKRLEIKNSNIVLSRIHGSLIGGAVGDALGYTVEFSNLVGIRRIYGERGITRYSLDDRGLAIISDDTQMTLFTATSLLFGVTHGIMKGIMDSLESYVWELGYEVWLRTQAFESYEDIARNSKGVRTSLNLQWLQNINELYSRRAPGMTCLSALESGNMGTIEKPINNSKGCGGVMRVAPVGIYSYKYFNGECNIVMLGAKVAAITHGHELGYIPAGMLSHLVWSIIDNIKGGMTLLDHVTRSLTVTKTCFKDALHINEFDNIINRAIELSEQSMPDHEAIAILGEGWVAEEALAIAIYSALKHKDNFKDAIVSSVNHSGDSDSTGSICGNIIGAFLGVSAIPHYYIDRLELKDIIKEIGDDLHSGCIVRNYDYIDNSEKRRWKDKYIMGNYPIK